MWTATIVQKGIKEGAYLVNVSYTNGTLSFNEVIDMTGGTTDVLSAKIQSKLNTLNTTQTLAGQVTTGPFTPTVPTQSVLQVFLSKLNTYQSTKRAVDMGLIQNTDPIFTTAQSDLKASFDPSFIGQF